MHISFVVVRKLFTIFLMGLGEVMECSLRVRLDKLLQNGVLSLK